MVDKHSDIVDRLRAYAAVDPDKAEAADLIVEQRKTIARQAKELSKH